MEDLLNGFHQELTTYMENMEFDEQTYQEVEERLNVINSLKDKYGPSIEDVTAYGQKAEKRYNMLCDAEHEIEILKNEQERIRERYLKEAKNLSEQRCKVAKTLGSNITKALEDLNFLDVRFEIEVTKKDQISADGMDQIRFMISTNPGLPMRPVQEVASGGELSRIMLALKSVAAQADGVDTLIFDEIDTGISGETANRVAKKMAVISKDHQVIAITHLPQIAAMADSHFEIEKNVRRKRDRHIDPSIIRGRFCQRTGKNAWRRENYGFCSGKCQRDEGIGTGTKICKTQIKRSPHTKREITKQSVVSLFFAGGESKSVPARELDDRRENKRNAAVLPCGGKDGNANDEKTKIPKSPACAGGAVSDPRCSSWLRCHARIPAGYDVCG